MGLIQLAFLFLFIRQIKRIQSTIYKAGEPLCDEDDKCFKSTISVQIAESYRLNINEYKHNMTLHLIHNTIPIVKSSASVTPSDLTNFRIDSFSELTEIIKASVDPQQTSISYSLRNVEEKPVLSFSVKYIGFKRNFSIFFDTTNIDGKEQLFLIGKLFNKVNELEEEINALKNEINEIKHSYRIINQLPDSALTASNSHDNNHRPIYGRIGSSHISGKSHAWCVKSMADYLSIDMQKVYNVTAILTQGRGDGAQWVTKYSLSTSKDGKDWTNHGEFNANGDQHSVVHNYLNDRDHVTARFVKLTPTKCYGHCSMRFDVLVKPFLPSD